MKAQLFLLTACLSLAADLGVISPRHGILLDTQTTRPDFQHFEVELKPADTTNVTTLTLTNVLLTVDDMVALPSGRTVMGLKSYFWDGSVSDLAIYTFDLRRADPPTPSAVRAALSAGSEPPKSLINEMARRQVEKSAERFPPMPHRYFSTNIAGQRSTNLADYASPPVTWNPADYTNQETYGRVSTDVTIRFPTNAPPELRPLPNATNQTYAEYLDWLADRKGKRRNE